MNWGSWGKQLDQRDMIALINHCVENEITSFDHADIYGGYTTESEFGNAFSESGIDRDQVEFISKCGIQYMSENRTNKVKHYDYSKSYIIASVERSLKALRTDYLDLFLLHRPSPLMQAEEISEAVTQLIKNGKIKSFGVSNFTPSQVDLISSAIPVKVNQIEFSLTHHSAMHNGVLDQMLQHDIRPMAWSPLGSVFKSDTEESRRIHRQLGQLRDTYEATEDQLLLAWIMKHPSGIHPVIGTTDANRITNANKAVNIDLDLEDWFLMLVASQGHKVP